MLISVRKLFIFALLITGLFMNGRALGIMPFIDENINAAVIYIDENFVSSGAVKH